MYGQVLYFALSKSILCLRNTDDIPMMARPRGHPMRTPSTRGTIGRCIDSDLGRMQSDSVEKKSIRNVYWLNLF